MKQTQELINDENINSKRNEHDVDEYLSKLDLTPNNDSYLSKTNKEGVSAVNCPSKEKNVNEILSKKTSIDQDTKPNYVEEVIYIPDFPEQTIDKELGIAKTNFENVNVSFFNDSDFFEEFETDSATPNTKISSSIDLDSSQWFKFMGRTFVDIENVFCISQVEKSSQKQDRPKNSEEQVKPFQGNILMEKVTPSRKEQDHNNCFIIDDSDKATKDHKMLVEEFLSDDVIEEMGREFESPKKDLKKSLDLSEINLVSNDNSKPSQTALSNMVTLDHTSNDLNTSSKSSSTSSKKSMKNIMDCLKLPSVRMRRSIKNINDSEKERPVPDTVIEVRPLKDLQFFKEFDKRLKDNCSDKYNNPENEINNTYIHNPRIETCTKSEIPFKKRYFNNFGCNKTYRNEMPRTISEAIECASQRRTRNKDLEKNIDDIVTTSSNRILRPSKFNSSQLESQWNNSFRNQPSVIQKTSLTLPSIFQEKNEFSRTSSFILPSKLQENNYELPRTPVLKMNSQTIHSTPQISHQTRKPVEGYEDNHGQFRKQTPVMQKSSFTLPSQLQEKNNEFLRAPLFELNSQTMPSYLSSQILHQTRNPSQGFGDNHGQFRNQPSVMQKSSFTLPSKLQEKNNHFLRAPLFEFNSQTIPSNLTPQISNQTRNPFRSSEDNHGQFRNQSSVIQKSSFTSPSNLQEKNNSGPLRTPVLNLNCQTLPSYLTPLISHQTQKPFDEYVDYHKHLPKNDIGCKKRAFQCSPENKTQHDEVFGTHRDVIHPHFNVHRNTPEPTKFGDISRTSQHAFERDSFSARERESTYKFRSSTPLNVNFNTCRTPQFNITQQNMSTPFIQAQSEMIPSYQSSSDYRNDLFKEDGRSDSIREAKVFLDNLTESQDYLRNENNNFELYPTPNQYYKRSNSSGYESTSSGRNHRYVQSQYNIGNNVTATCIRCRNYTHENIPSKVESFGKFSVNSQRKRRKFDNYFGEESRYENTPPETNVIDPQCFIKQELTDDFNDQECYLSPQHFQGNHLIDFNYHVQDFDTPQKSINYNNHEIFGKAYITETDTSLEYNCQEVCRQEDLVVDVFDKPDDKCRNYDFYNSPNNFRHSTFPIPRREVYRADSVAFPSSDQPLIQPFDEKYKSPRSWDVVKQFEFDRKKRSIKELRNSQSSTNKR